LWYHSLILLNTPVTAKMLTQLATISDNALRIKIVSHVSIPTWRSRI